MKRSLASLAALLVLAVCAASALANPPGSVSYPKDQVVPRAKVEFDKLREETKVKHKENPDFIGYIDRMEARFNAQANAVLPADRKYNKYEIEYLKELFDQVILPQIEEVKSALDDPELNNEQAQDRFEAIAAAAPQKVQIFTAGFVEARRAGYNASVLHENGNGGTTRGIGDAISGVGNTVLGIGNAVGEELKPTPEVTPPSLEDMIDRSPVVKLGVESANYSVKPTPDPQPNPKPDGGAPTPWPRPTAPPQGGGTTPATPGATPSDIIRTIASNGGTLMANRGAYELQQGNYAEALRLAQRALSIEPSNRGALEVLYAAKGRGDGINASAAAMAPAKAGAAAFAPSEFAGGAPGGVAPGIAAVAAAGAARLAGEQARNGAIAALKLGDSENALGILTKALNHDPNNPALLNLRAQTYGRLGRWEEALKDASAGASLVPGNAALLSIKALAENRTRRWRDALATSERLIAADPRGPWGYANRAHAWAGLGNRDAMLSDINRAAALDPRFQQAAADAALLQLPSEGDVMFLFPGESAKGATNAPAAGRGKSFGLVMGAGIVGGLLLALGLLSLVLAPIKESVVSVFTRAKRAAPATNSAVATAQPASVGGNVGGLIRGQYEISRQIGAGGMGMVYEGTDRSLGRRVAIKKMRDELRQNPRDRERFIIEAKTVASLHHPNIVDIYAIAEDGDDVYLVFEYVDGKTVHDLIQSSGRLGAAEALGVTRAMGEALTYAHSRGVIHRDMKPSNVMLTGDGRVKVMDFGIARMAKDALTRYSMTNTIVGTPPYMAPEQEQGVVRKESDVYALAVCAYEMLTGKIPFIGIGAGMLMNKINMSYIPPSRNIAGLPGTLDDVFLKAFQADPDQRYRAPQEFAAALEGAFGGIPGRA